jgi:hypothetical protein
LYREATVIDNTGMQRETTMDKIVICGVEAIGGASVGGTQCLCKKTVGAAYR